MVSSAIDGTFSSANDEIISRHCDRIMSILSGHISRVIDGIFFTHIYRIISRVNDDDWTANNGTFARHNGLQK